MFRFSSFSRVRFADINFYMVSSKGSPALPGFFRPPAAGREGREASRPSRRATETAAPGDAGEGRARGTGTPGKRPHRLTVMRGAGHPNRTRNRPTAQKRRTERRREAAHPEGGQIGTSPRAQAGRKRPSRRSGAAGKAEQTDEHRRKSKLYKIIFCIIFGGRPLAASTTEHYTK